MTEKYAPPPAELADRTVQVVACSMFTVALILCLSVAEFFVAAAAASVIDIVVKVLAVFILASIAMTFVWKIRPMSPEQRRQYMGDDGFLQSAFQKAMAASWMLSFLILGVLQALDSLVLERLPNMPLDIVIKSVLALMLLLFSVAFLRYASSSDGDE